MDYNALIDLGYQVQGQLWVDKVNKTYGTGHLCQWVSTFHPGGLPCQLEGTFHYGAFNAGMKMVFRDGTAWMVRFPRVGNVKALGLIREGTSIPVPKVQAWGPAARNPLGLGPFIIMDFIDGVSLSDVLKDPNAKRPMRLMREDISDDNIEAIYKQFANFLLQLFKLDFDRIGSLPSPSAEAESPRLIRPLTFKAHTILRMEELTLLGFATTTEYFQYVVGQDWEQLVHQPNSISLIPNLVNANYDRGKFKLICDDLGLANLIVRSREDLTIVGVVDLEWSYIGPAQLFGSAPWWLLQDRPVNSVWDCDNDEPPKVAERYFRYLEIFKRVLEEEEAKMPGHEEKELSSLVKWSQDSGAMWLHMLLSAGFNDQCSFPFTQLRQHLGAAEWARQGKVRELDEYDRALEKREEYKALVDSEKMTREDFIAMF
ncbi:phosphotransferase enzyme family protein [Phialemonium atrogriseum]|uniref:Phosphotransferase enzyme family protein n=1 Tax=Phialemonium atrogriseum TaxID=1093897 RepID=A0AAJ0FRE9_9PEZI|nr:phosphotransferase enzyme family protein [Phialemonium atrogriseum]KAK1770070.1 phosphotransferase enzyme family protein [Phialemonium atrogriseum]